VILASSPPPLLLLLLLLLVLTLKLRQHGALTITAAHMLASHKHLRHCAATCHLLQAVRVVATHGISPSSTAQHVQPELEAHQEHVHQSGTPLLQEQ
jgi:hypothetical protein